ncbi:MAG: hypothetical protein ACREIN_00960, partial [Candidatus Methylomirabilaceae bacterium]
MRNGTPSNASLHGLAPKRGAAFQRSIAVFLAGAALLVVGSGWTFLAPEGLPDSPAIPDLYDPDMVSTYTLAAKRPYQVNGRQLAPWLIATVLTPQAAHVGPPLATATPGAAVTRPKDVILVIGYVTDTRDGRIIAVTETLGHPSDNKRSIKAWVDEGWVKDGKGSGEWRPPIRSDGALDQQQAAAFMGQVH